MSCLRLARIRLRRRVESPGRGQEIVVEIAGYRWRESLRAPDGCAGIERGDEDPRRTGFPRPLAKSGLDLAIEVQNPGLSISEANPGDGRLYPVALLVSGVPRGRAPRRPSIPIRFPGGLPGPKPSKSPLGLDPAPRSLRSENPPVASGQRAGPVRFEPRVSPDFRAAVSLGLLTFAPNPLDGKRPNPAGCAEPPRPRWTTLCISVGGPNS